MVVEGDKVRSVVTPDDYEPDALLAAEKLIKNL
jgi:hypothetical protein